jgi:hypothetical protein
MIIRHKCKKENKRRLAFDELAETRQNINAVTRTACGDEWHSPDEEN